MKRFNDGFYIVIAVIAFLFAFVAHGGTSVGNFSRKFQPEFDFEIRYPNSWILKSSTVMSEGTAETWQVSNQVAVPDPSMQSHIEFAFIKSFPAKNATELLNEIKRRHPGLSWVAVNNPDFVGYQSTPEPADQSSLRNMEYYLAESGKVVRINVSRNAQGNGAAEADLILSTIRKPSLPMFVESVAFNQNHYRVGDRACVLFYVDALKLLGPPTVDVVFSGELKHWKFREQKFNEEKGVFEVCQNLTAAMPSNALHIERVTIENGMKAVLCGRSEDHLKCQSGGAARISKSFFDPVFVNDAPDRAGPTVTAFKANAEQNGFTLNCQDPSGVSFAQIDFQDTGAIAKRQMILYEDELKDPTHVYYIPKSILNNGFNLIQRVTLFDKVGNVTMLAAIDPTNKNYQLIYSDKAPQPSVIPYVSIRR